MSSYSTRACSPEINSTFAGNLLDLVAQIYITNLKRESQKPRMYVIDGGIWPEGLKRVRHKSEITLVRNRRGGGLSRG